MIITNTFSAGMAADIEALFQGKGYRFASNGRIRFNRKRQVAATIEDATQGSTADFSNLRGTIDIATLPEGCKFKGAVKVKEGAVVFLAVGFESIIGLLTITEPSRAFTSFQVIYTDRNDPNRQNNPYLRATNQDTDREKLMLGRVKGFSVYENERIQRVYFVDGINQERTFNLYDFFIDGDLSKPYHYLNSHTADISYPGWMSVHAMNAQPSACLPILRFEQRVQGRLKTGTYRILVRYKNKNGVKSPFSMPSPLVFVTNQPLEDYEVSGMTDALRSNHHNRVMADRNGVETKEGIRFKIEDVDSRWDEIEIAYVYYQTTEIHSEAFVFSRLPILGQDRVIQVDLTANGPVGAVFYPITTEEMTKVFQTVLSTGSIAEQQGRLWAANLRLLPDVRLDMSKVQFRPAYKYLREDETIEPTFEYVENKVTGRYDNDPLTNTSVETTNIPITRYAGKIDALPIVNDRRNYKGQQVAASLKGYFRGETYELGGVLFDTKGNPLLVESAGSYTLPHQYENFPMNTLTRKGQDGKYDLRVTGITVSGIRLPIDMLYDELGNLTVSGFAIVRKERKQVLKHQGVIFPTVMGPKCETKTADDGWVKPLGFPYNNFLLDYSPAYRGDGHVYAQGLVSCNNKPSWWEFGKSTVIPIPAVSTPYIFNYHSPDVLIEETLSSTDGVYLKQVGHAHQAYSKNAIQLAGARNWHLYTKSYNTTPLGFINPQAEALYTNQGRPAMGEQSRVEWAKRHTQVEDSLYEKFDSNYWQYDYQAQTEMFRRGFSYPSFGHQQPGSVILRASDWKSVDLAETGHGSLTNEESDERSCSYRIVNWYGPADEVSPNYFSTGYYFPITPESLSELRLERDSTGKPVAYVIDDAEVFGGDCYTTLFDFTRILSGLDSCKENPGGAAADFPDMACSHIIPIESKYNLALRYGRKFAANATSTAMTYCKGESIQFSKGIMIRQPEDWNINKALMVSETFRFFQARPQDVNYVSHWPDGVMWSPKKVYSEEMDQFRIKLPLNRGVIEGSSGEVTGLIPAFDTVYYIRERSFGYLKINPQVFIPTDVGEVQVTSGEVYSGSKDIALYGTKYPFSIWASGDRFGFVDTVMKKVVGFSQAGRDLVSESNNVDDLVRAISMNVEGFKPQDSYWDIVAGYDAENSEVLYSFHGKNEALNTTLVYSVSLAAFTGVYPILPTAYFSYDDYLLSFIDNDKLHLHNYGKFGQWYGEYHDTVLRFVVHPAPTMGCVFTNGHIVSNENITQRLVSVRAWTEDESHTMVPIQQQGSSIVSIDDRFDFRKERYSFPLHEWDWEDVKQQLKGHKLYIELTIKNSLALADEKDLMVGITSFDTSYRYLKQNQY